jgi:hypothetical protein
LCYFMLHEVVVSGRVTPGAMRFRKSAVTTVLSLGEPLRRRTRHASTGIDRE